MKVIKIAQVPAPTVVENTSVLEAVRIMEKAAVGAVVVVAGDRLAGILSERDVMLRVVGAQRDPRSTAVAEVMTAALETATVDTDSGEALQLMISRHIRHLPVVDGEQLAGLLSIRNLLQHHVDVLVGQLNSMEAYFMVDGPGG